MRTAQSQPRGTIWCAGTEGCGPAALHLTKMQQGCEEASGVLQEAVDPPVVYFPSPQMSPP